MSGAEVGGATPTPADRDRATAAEVLDAAGTRHEFHPALTEAVAAALAAERERATAPVREVLAALDQWGDDLAPIQIVALRRALRRALTVTEGEPDEH